jgi:excisionase family DNA binding protein
MKLVETLKNKTRALKVTEIAGLLGVTPQHIYKMAARGSIPSFRISGSVRFDPDEVAAWLQGKQNPLSGELVHPGSLPSFRANTAFSRNLVFGRFVTEL